MNSALLIPVFVQVALTFVLVFTMGAMRYRATTSGKVKPADIVLGQRAWPVRVQQVSNAYENQLASPLLFYAGIAFALIAGATSVLLVVLAWAYVGLRLLHALIHVTSNHLRSRFMAFAAGLLVLLGYWVVFALELMTR
ncbi:MAPEG family protein [uncultured Maricaulis sp.]|uniref:MAPEG family protein n=1 Tax=uncultured Maricaulis sp. TaxID=174710 RepID=UPI0030DDB97B|tara:strand:+ start:155832 stop:156248 length:417 start_codon:yes stop_codon:yes gene_type:complete